MSFVSFAFLPLLLLCTPAAPYSGADDFGHQLGTIDFDVSGKADAQAHVVRGVKLLHHMMYVEADQEFAAAIEADPDCALAYWGRAMAIVHPLWPDVPSEAELAKGWELVKTGLAREPKMPRERAYLETIQTYFRDASGRDHKTRLRELDDAWEQLAQTYPDDQDAAFSALFHLAPARFLPREAAQRIQLAAGAIVQDVLAKNPDHPGAQHYKIHAYDSPFLADRALEICDRYGTIAPEVPHALHMPTHIFTRRGLWERSIEFNRRSAEAAQKLGQSAGSINGHYLHALDYLAYAYLQRGQYRLADAVREEMLALSGPYHASGRTTMAFAFAAVPARCALERHDWAAAARLEPRRPASFPWSEQFLYCDSIVHFARALGAIRSGDLDTARFRIVELEQLGRRISAAHPSSYWAAQTETQILTARAWLALADGAQEEAVALMRRAAKLEATVDKDAVTPGEVLPAGELLGDLLAEIGRHRDALAAYQAMLETSPNRLKSLYGAARAAELAGEAETAARYYEQLRTIAADADPDLEPLQHATAFLAGSM